MKTFNTHTDERGRLILPPEVAQHLGLSPGVKVTLEENENSLTITRPITSLKRVYVEVTNRCNLNCATCMRNVWQVEFGRMQLRTFERILTGIEAFSPKPEIFFGGYGEPLSNPDCLTMLGMAKTRGLRASLITNGTLLSEDISRQLIELGLDRLWVSLDGACPKSYADVRHGASLSEVIANLERLHALRQRRHGDSLWVGRPLLGIAFVAMQSNIEDLPALLELGERLGATYYAITNLLAHTAEQWGETLYQDRLYQGGGSRASDPRPRVDLTSMDGGYLVSEQTAPLFGGDYRLALAGASLPDRRDRCPFLERGALAVRWDGAVSPCLPLMYTHTYYLDDRKHTSYAYHTGNVDARPLFEIWAEEAYAALRQRLEAFNFSPCTYCNSCELANDNLEDCFANVHPSCGTCLWAQGLIRCP